MYLRAPCHRVPGDAASICDHHHMLECWNPKWGTPSLQCRYACCACWLVVSPVTVAIHHLLVTAIHSCFSMLSPWSSLHSQQKWRGWNHVTLIFARERNHPQWRCYHAVQEFQSCLNLEDIFYQQQWTCQLDYEIWFSGHLLYIRSPLGLLKNWWCLNNLNEFVFWMQVWNNHLAIMGEWMPSSLVEVS